MTSKVETRKSAYGGIALCLNGPSKEMYAALENSDYSSILLEDGDKEFKDLSFLVDYKEKIRGLSISGCTKIGFISKLEFLEQLFINSTVSVDFSPLKRLRHLTIYTRKQGDSIGTLNSLTHLNIHGWKQKDLKWLSGLKNLVNLYMIDSRSLEDLSGVGQLTSLTSLSLSTKTNLIDCSALADSVIKIFSIEVCRKLKDVSFLSKMNNLLYFGTDLDIPGLNLLSEIQNLKEIIFHGKVEDNDVEILKSFPALIRCRFIDKRGYNAKYKEIETYLDKKWGIPNLWNQTSLAILGYEVPEFKLFPDS